MFGKERYINKRAKKTNKCNNKTWFNTIQCNNVISIKQSINETCDNARRLFNRAQNSFLRNRSDDNRIVYIREKQSYNQTKSKAKASYSIQEKSKLSNLCKSKPRTFWKYVKKLYQHNSCTSDNFHISELYDNFKDLYISNNIDNNVVENDESFIIDEYLDTNISIEELIEAVNKQNNIKSSGID